MAYEFTLEDIKKIRNLTGVGLTDAKRALRGQRQLRGSPRGDARQGPGEGRPARRPADPGRRHPQLRPRRPDRRPARSQLRDRLRRQERGFSGFGQGPGPADSGDRPPLHQAWATRRPKTRRPANAASGGKASSRTPKRASAEMEPSEGRMAKLGEKIVLEPLRPLRAWTAAGRLVAAGRRGLDLRGVFRLYLNAVNGGSGGKEWKIGRKFAQGFPSQAPGRQAGFRQRAADAPDRPGPPVAARRGDGRGL